jgi:putative addiction module antidote
MFNLRLYKNGNSVVMTIPKEVLKEHNLREGSAVVVENRGDEVVISSKKRVVAKTMKEINSKFAQMVDEFINEHEDVLSELSHR